jgi:hypothetical protein
MSYGVHEGTRNVQYARFVLVPCHAPCKAPMYHGQARCLPVNAWGFLHG